MTRGEYLSWLNREREPALPSDSWTATFIDIADLQLGQRAMDKDGDIWFVNELGHFGFFGRIGNRSGLFERGWLSNIRQNAPFRLLTRNEFEIIRSKWK